MGAAACGRPTKFKTDLFIDIRIIDTSNQVVGHCKQTIKKGLLISDGLCFINWLDTINKERKTC